MKRNLICLLLTGACNIFSLFADPALPDSVLVHQPDGTNLWVYDRGDEYYNWVESTDGYVIIKNTDGIFEYATITDSQIRPSGLKVCNIQNKEVSEENYAKSQKGVIQQEIKRRRLDARVTMTKHRTVGIPSSPVVGTRKVLTILVGFSDKPLTYSVANFDSLMNYSGYSGFLPGGSVCDYYYENSYGQLNIKDSVIGPFVASNPSSYYSRPQGGAVGHSIDLVEEAINWADSQGIDFSLFDGNNDGYVDCIHIIFAGNRSSASGNGIIWPFHSTLVMPIIKDGKSISEFIMTPELFHNAGTNINSIGTICHELGHVLGAPDFYSIDSSPNAQDSLGTGLWDVMDSGGHYNGGYSPTHHNPYTKTAIFQWAAPNTINSSEKNSIYNIPASSQCSTAIYKIPTATTGEYYLLENRQKVSFDRNLPDSGLLIYHIHSDIENAVANNIVNSTLPQMCYVVNPKSTQALPTDTSSYGITSRSIFPYSSEIMDTTSIFFTTKTNPRSQSWAGVSTGVDACFIQHNGNNIKFVVNPEIEGPSTMTDTTAWYHIRNVPAGATITWSIQNISPQAFQFEIVSPQNRDSMRIAVRSIPLGPGVPINGHSETDGLIPSYMRADLTVTISSGGQSYSTTKRIRREVSSMPFLLKNENSNDNAPKVTMQGDYIQISETKESSTLELWHAMYGRVLTQTVTNNTEQIDIRNLPRGVYVVVQKEGDTIISQTKVLIQ